MGRNGGIIGPANTPTTSVAGGVWSLAEVFDAVGADIWPAPPLAATGGTTSTATIDGTAYKIHTFTSSGTFTITSGAGLLEYIVVAGGASGGVTSGGAGAAYTVGTNGGASTIVRSSGGTFTTVATVGGGRGASYHLGNGGNGGSGGGGTFVYSPSTGSGGAGTSGEGFAGGSCSWVNTSSHAAGGGGGAAAVGSFWQRRRCGAQ